MSEQRSRRMSDSTSECRMVVNGANRTLAGPVSVTGLVGLLTAGTAGVAVARNGTVVPRSRWDDELVVDGDTIEVVTAVQGG